MRSAFFIIFAALFNPRSKNPILYGWVSATKPLESPSVIRGNLVTSINSLNASPVLEYDAPLPKMIKGDLEFCIRLTMFWI